MHLSLDFKFNKIIINGYAQYAQYAWIVIQYKIWKSEVN